MKTIRWENLLAPIISIVVPIKNEAENIGSLILEICDSLPDDIRFEIVYVDDGSTDNSLLKLKELMKVVPQLRTFCHENSCGQSAAISTGVRMEKGKIIVTLDGDGQNDPQDIPVLLKAFNENGNIKYLLVSGHRLKRLDNCVKKMSSRVANGVRSFILGDRTPDSGCGIKVFSKTTFISLPGFDHMHRFLPALVIRAGGKVISVPVNHRVREHGKSKYGTWHRLWVGITDLLGVLWLRSRGSIPVVSQIKD